ncbi:MAG: hypothetical protein JOZ81_01365 [Chloroflexi bacterium]|nr:hypothetical protein [Chloroflexota bacterium]
MFSRPSFRHLRRYGAVLLAVGVVATGLPSATSAAREEHTFNLVVNNAKLLPCLTKDPDDQPTARVTVTRGELNDTLKLEAEGLKPDLKFDLFTVQRSDKLADGSADPNFHNFGMAWYQTDVQANREGKANVEIKTILLDQIFGFDPDANLAPTNTFHVGFWFNNPDDAAPCGFPTVTPFNGEHHAGVLAMISLPEAATGLGPLCTKPNSKGGCDG